MNASHNNGSTPLLVAVEMGHLDIVKALVEQGNAVRSKKNKWDDSAADVAKGFGLTQIYIYLNEFFVPK